MRVGTSEEATGLMADRLNMEVEKTGGPAFPTKKPLYGWGDSNQGMTLRDYFAAHAMQALIINGATLSTSAPLSARAYEIADNMIKRRSE